MLSFSINNLHSQGPSTFVRLGLDDHLSSTRAMKVILMRKSFPEPLVMPVAQSRSSVDSTAFGFCARLKKQCLCHRVGRTWSLDAVEILHVSGWTPAFVCQSKKKERNGTARMFGSQGLAGVRLRVDKRVKKLNAGQASAKLGGCLRLDTDGAGGEKKWCQARTHTVSCNLQTTEVLGTCCGSLNGDLAVDGSLKWYGWGFAVCGAEVVRLERDGAGGQYFGMHHWFECA